MSNLGIIIEREFLERVKKKSFIITTILMPVLMLALMAMPALVMLWAGQSETRVAVIDESHQVLPALENDEAVRFQPALSHVVDSVIANEGADAVLVIPANAVADKKATLKFYSDGPSSMPTE